uniref:Uncharacterized protein n=1 Tax=Rhizophora mucronata TaxID=61149 RepID=A0A2P2Q164_RHIMU
MDQEIWYEFSVLGWSSSSIGCFGSRNDQRDFE